MKDDVIVIDAKDEFKHLPQATLAKAIATASLGYLNLLAFYC